MTPKKRTGSERNRLGRKRREGRPGTGTEEKQRPCSAPECGRLVYARGLCQTHHRHLLKTGKVETIRPYRKRSSDTVKFAGLRVSPHCAQQVERYATRKSISTGAAIAEILDRWLVKKRRPVPRRAP